MSACLSVSARQAFDDSVKQETGKPHNDFSLFLSLPLSPSIQASCTSDFPSSRMETALHGLDVQKILVLQLNWCHRNGWETEVFGEDTG